MNKAQTCSVKHVKQFFCDVFGACQTRLSTKHNQHICKIADAAPRNEMHPWFRGNDWENIHRYPAPYYPELNNQEDTRRFDDGIPAEARPLLHYC